MTSEDVLTTVSIAIGSIARRTSRTAGMLVCYSRRQLSFLEMLDALNEDLLSQGEPPVAFEHDCREGICGSCGFLIHGGRRGTTTCQLSMRFFKHGDTLTLEPWRAQAFPVIRDLIVNRSAFDRIIQSGGFISAPTGSAPSANSILVPKEAVSVLIVPARAHIHLLEAAAETALLLAQILTALEPAVRTGAPDLGKLPTRVQAALNRLNTAAQEAAHERRSRLSDHPDPEPLFRTLRRLQQDILALNRMFGAPWPDRVHAVLAPPWSAYAQAVAAELRILAAALPSRHPPPDSSAPRTAMVDFIAAIETIRSEGITRALPTDALGRILGSAFGAEQLQRDLDDFTERTRGVTTSVR